MTLTRGSAVRRNDMEKFFDLFWKHPNEVTLYRPSCCPTIDASLGVGMVGGVKAVIEAAIRKAAKKPTGELTKVNLEKVTWLSLSYNQLTDVTALKELTQLTVLGLGDNQLTDVTALKELTQLTRLWLNRNQLTDITALKGLTQLTRLDLNDNPALTKAQIAELQKALPKCVIYSNSTK